jgi:Zn finger protein HypA/HybF involved in hydrogenase expression
MYCTHGIRLDRDCRWCATGTEPTVTKYRACPACGKTDFASEMGRDLHIMSCVKFG